MLVYRVFHHQEGAEGGTSGSPLYIHGPQGEGRWDNFESYTAWYLSKSPEGAIGESFGNLPLWRASMFDPGIPGMRKAMAVFSISDDVRIYNFDDASNLLAIGMRPSDVVIRNVPATQARAAKVFGQRNGNGTRRWQGLQWWSYHHPQWTNMMVWQPGGEECKLELRDIVPLDLGAAAVREAAEVLQRKI